MTGLVYVLPEHIAYTRAKAGEPFEYRLFGPRGDDMPEKTCPGCLLPLAVGDYTTLIPIGPGDDEEARERCREGRWYNAVSIEAHFGCATGMESQE